MSLNSLNDLLTIYKQTSWQEPPLQSILRYWEAAVGSAVAAHTQPRSLQRDVLWVATSGAAWAQTLTFERQRILHKLNPHLSSVLSDIRFSSVGWGRTQDRVLTTTASPHPSLINSSYRSSNSDRPAPRDPKAAFTRWANTIRDRAASLPLCPRCHCPTPPGELQRWDICSVCASKQW